MANRVPRIVRMPSKQTGLAATLVWKLLRASDWFLFDWGDETFKASAWGDVDGSSTEVDATNLPGVYRVTTAPDLESAQFTTGWYYLFFEESGTGEHGLVCFYVRNGKMSEEQVFVKPVEAVDADLTKIGGDATLLTTWKRAQQLILDLTVDTTGFTPTTTQWETSDYTDADTGALVGRTIYFLDGNRAMERGEISAYSLVSGRGHITVSGALSGAPASGDRFLVL